MEQQFWNRDTIVSPHRFHDSPSRSSNAGGGDGGGGGSLDSSDSQLASLRCWRRVKCQGEIPGPRSGAASVVVGNKLYMFGGYGGNGRLDDFFEFDLDSKKWSRVHYASPSPGVRENNGVVEYKGKLYLFGGYNGNSWLNDFHEFDPVTRIWRTVEPRGTPPASRFGYVSVVHEDRFVLFGGYDGTTWLNDTHEYNFKTELWRTVETNGQIPSIRSCPSWCKEGKHVFVFGGYDGVRRMNDFFTCDLETYTWRQLPCHGAVGDVPSPRYFHACAMYSGKMYTFGGFNGTERLNDMYEYNFENNCWRALHKDQASHLVGTLSNCQLSPPYNSNGSIVRALLPNPNNNPNGGLLQSSALPPPPGGGHVSLPSRHSHGGAADWASNGQSNGSIGSSPCLYDVPSGRSSLVSQVYKNSLFVFGGYNGQIVLNDFFEFRFDPVAVPKSNFMSDLKSLINNEALSDVTFIVEGQPVYASRIHLAVRSEHFRAMFYGGMRESLDKSNDQKIEIEDISYEVFLKILEFLYTDRVEEIQPEIAVHLLMAAERFLLDRLKSLCEASIQKSVTPQNVVNTLLAAHTHHATSLKEMALEFVLDHLDAVKETSSFALLKSEPDLLMEIIMKSA